MTEEKPKMNKSLLKAMKDSGFFTNDIILFSGAPHDLFADYVMGLDIPNRTYAERLEIILNTPIKKLFPDFAAFYDE